MVLHWWLGNITTADWVFRMLIQSAVLFLIGWILARAARRISAPLKSGILLTLIVLLVLLPAGIFIFRTDQGSLYKLPISPRGEAFGIGLKAREDGSIAADLATLGLERLKRN